jgi:hypothetical protein
MGIKSFFKNLASDRPLDSLSILGGLRDFLFGIGFVFGLDQIQQTLLYQNYDALIAGVTAPLAGWLMLIIGVLVIVSALMHKTEITRFGLLAQCLLWLFSAIMYALSHEIILAMIFGVFFSLPAAYLRFYYTRRKYWKTIEGGDVNAKGKAKQGDQEGHAT